MTTIRRGYAYHVATPLNTVNAIKHTRSYTMKYAICAIVLLIPVYLTTYKMSEDTVQFTVTDKERIVTGTGDTLSSKYLVFTEQEVYENSDTLLFFKFSSSDLQGQLKAGDTYTAVVAGWRVPFMSMYRNIITVK
jgi:hypothetical protein